VEFPRPPLAEISSPDVSGRVAARLKVPGADNVPGVNRSNCITFRPFSGRSFIIFSVMTVLRVAPRVSTGITASVTATLSVTAPTCRAAFTVAC
jgi:hypothetical protein